jgi:ribosomal-protein-alanine N-acetyltransferase
LLKPPPPFGLRELRLADLDRVMDIERLVYTAPWQPASYRHELANNRQARYHGLTVRQADRPTSLIGYAGYWLLVDEVHVSTIAVHPDWQGRGLGELMLLNTLFMAYREPAQLVTLEVRKSNQVAQALYHKYRLDIVGERRRYYRDNNEDAYIMTIEPLDDGYREFLREQKQRLFARLGQKRVFL